MESERSLLTLCEMKPSAWSVRELRHHHRILSDVSPWLNAQGNAIHHQIINEIMQRAPAANVETQTFET